MGSPTPDRKLRNDNPVDPTPNQRFHSWSFAPTFFVRREYSSAEEEPG